MNFTPQQPIHEQDVGTHIDAGFAMDGFNLLLLRMETLQLNPDEVRHIETDVFGDLAETCAHRGHKSNCAQNFCLRGMVAHEWENYCPNAETLNALECLPWFRKAGKV